MLPLLGEPLCVDEVTVWGYGCPSPFFLSRSVEQFDCRAPSQPSAPLSVASCFAVSFRRVSCRYDTLSRLAATIARGASYALR